MRALHGGQCCWAQRACHSSAVPILHRSISSCVTVITQGPWFCHEPGFGSDIKAVGVWKAPVSLNRNGDSLKLVCVLITFRSTALKQEIYFLIHVLRSTEHLAGSWAGLLSWCGDLPPVWAVRGRRKGKLQPRLHCQGSIDHLLHKPHWQHCLGTGRGV